MSELRPTVLAPVGLVTPCFTSDLVATTGC